MTNPRLLDVFKSREFTASASSAFFTARQQGEDAGAYIELFAGLQCERFPFMRYEIHGNAVMFMDKASRARQPACLVVSMSANQQISPSAEMYYIGCHAQLQLFGAGANDTPLAGDCEIPKHRIEAQGRMLLV